MARKIIKTDLESTEISGEKVKRIRTELLYKTQEEFAEDLGVTPEYISMIERGKKRLTHSMEEKIVKAFPYTKVFFPSKDEMMLQSLWEKAQERKEVIKQFIRASNQLICEVVKDVGFTCESHYLESQSDDAPAFIFHDKEGKQFFITNSDIYKYFHAELLDYVGFRINRIIQYGKECGFKEMKRKEEKENG